MASSGHHGLGPYEARKIGVFTPMPTVRARKLCWKLIVLPGECERYEQFSNWMLEILAGGDCSISTQK